MTLTATFGFLPSGEFGHWVSDMTPNFQGSANAAVAPRNTANANVNTSIVFKRNNLFM